MFYTFPLDNNNYLDELADSQFLIGNDLMAAPILEKGATFRAVYGNIDVNNTRNIYPLNEIFEVEEGLTF